jgi:hypothetical protein
MVAATVSSPKTSPQRPRYSLISWQWIAFLPSAPIALSSTLASLGRSDCGTPSLQELQGGRKVSLREHLRAGGRQGDGPRLEERLQQLQDRLALLLTDDDGCCLRITLDPDVNTVCQDVVCLSEDIIVLVEIGRLLARHPRERNFAWQAHHYPVGGR